MNQRFLWNAELTTLGEKWRKSSTSISDALIDSWFAKREEFQKNPESHVAFMNEIKREHAIQTGIIEHMYDLKRGVTETFIKEGFKESLLMHNDANIPSKQLIAHLTDHENGIDYIFQAIKDDRPFSIFFIKELHDLLLKNQNFIEVQTSAGLQKQELKKGEFKKYSNNPSRDGVVFLYCPPEQVESELQKIIKIYQNAEHNEKIHPIKLAAWFHHVFTLIHPFQDGNGRLARLLASFILIKHNYFPFTPLGNTDSKSYIQEYITALEKADNGDPNILVEFFAISQKRSIEKALNYNINQSSTLDFAIEALNLKFETKENENNTLIQQNKKIIFDIAKKYIDKTIKNMSQKITNRNISVSACKSADFETETSHYFLYQIIEYAKHYDYFLLKDKPKAWIYIPFTIQNSHYEIVFSFHHYGYDLNTISIGSFVMFSINGSKGKKEIIPLASPFVLSLLRKENLKEDIEKTLTQYLEKNVLLAISEISKRI